MKRNQIKSKVIRIDLFRSRIDNLLNFVVQVNFNFFKKPSYFFYTAPWSQGIKYMAILFEKLDDGESD